MTPVNKPRVEFSVARDHVEDCYRLSFLTYDIDGGEGTQGRSMDVDMAFASVAEATEFAEVMT